MTFRGFYWLIVFVGAVLYGAVASAQGLGSLVPLEAETAPAAITDWETTAQAAETALAGPTPSLFRLNRLREELVFWRDGFLNAEDINAGRIATVTAQIAALGPVPDNGEETAAVSARRSALEQQRHELRGPSLLAQESFARANGLIAEVDARLREREALALSERTSSPLNPGQWPAAFAALGQAVGNLVAETTAAIRTDINSGDLWRKLPLGLLYLGLAGVLLVRGRSWVLGLQTRIDNGSARGTAVWSFLLSVWQVILPFIGVIALAAALLQIDVLGVAGNAVWDAVLAGAVLIIVAHWLTTEFFPLGENNGPLRYSYENRRRGRRIGQMLAWGVAISQVLSALMGVVEAGIATDNVIILPIQIILSYLLFRFGQVIISDPVRPEGLDPEAIGPVGRARKLVGSLCLFVAIATPVLAAVGYSTASDALFMPAIVTLGILGVVVLLQRFVNDLWDLRGTSEGQTAGPLAPVLIGFVLLLLAMPVLALAWGAGVADLFEVWTRFREGFAIGDTRISPTDFVAFVATFALGYLLTRFIQGTLRGSVLPRTKLDLGGQNAVVAGFGYVGIMVSAIVAITLAGIDLSSLAIVAGALSVGIGFGLQNIVSNFVSGIILLIERPIGEGDWIEVNGTMGYVRDISVRSTRIETFDRTDVIIPNADLVSGQVTNWTRGNAVGRVIVPVGVAYGTDTNLVMSILKEVATSHPMVLLNPPPNVLFLQFGDNSLDFEIRAILRDVNFVMVVKSEMNIEIEKRFREAGIEIPFPQRDLWIKNPEDLKGKPST